MCLLELTDIGSERTISYILVCGCPPMTGAGPEHAGFERAGPRLRSQQERFTCSNEGWFLLQVIFLQTYL